MNELTIAKNKMIENWIKHRPNDLEYITTHLDRIIEYLSGNAPDYFYERENYTTPKKWGNFVPATPKIHALEYGAHLGIYVDTLKNMAIVAGFPIYQWQYDEMVK